MLGHECVESPIRVLAKTMHGKAVGQNRRAAKLEQWKGLDQAGVKIGVEDTAIRAYGLRLQGQVAEDILSEQLRDGGAAIDEAAGDGDAVVVVVFQCAQGAGNW